MNKTKLAYIVIICSIITVMIVILYSKSIKLVDNYSMNELNYWKSKADVINEIDNFITKKAPTHNLSSILLLKYSDKYQVGIPLILAQGLLESHYGTKGLARKTNSVWNVGAWDNGAITHTYNHPNESIEPYIKLISTKYLVSILLEEELLVNFIDKNGNRYASYPHYEQELKFILNEINSTTKLDSLLSIYYHYKLEYKR